MSKMNDIILINIGVVSVLVSIVVAYLFLRQQKKAVMDEVNRLSLRLTEMETKTTLPSNPALTLNLSPRSEGNSQDADKANSLEGRTSDLSAMTNEELFGYLSKTIRDEELFRRPNLNRNAVKERFSLSAIRIGNAFARGGGMSLPEFVRNCRLDYACRLMVEQPEMPFTKIGSQSGYRRTTTFYHDFKTRFGMPPADYREQELSQRMVPNA